MAGSVSGVLRVALLAGLALSGPVVARVLDGTAHQPWVAYDGGPLPGGDTTNGVGEGLSAAYGSGSTQGWTQPVRAPVVSGFRTPDRPTHDGVDLAAPRYTPVVAAASGTVVAAYCNAVDVRDGSDWGCYRDGDPYLVSGCGWYVDIIHSGHEMTRYCHMVSEPLVAVGDFVVAGQRLGQIGSTGNSSGPHLHFEVHVNADPRFGGPVDPEPWMSDHGAPLGQGSPL